MHIQIVLLSLFLICPCVTSLFSQDALKDIVLTYDLNRKAKYNESGRYNIDKFQLVHVEPICDENYKGGKFCAVVLEMDNRRFRRGGTVKLVHSEDSEIYYYLESDPFFERCKDDCDFQLKIKLTTEKGYTSRQISKVPESFYGRLKGRRMDVEVEGGSCDGQYKAASPPWVCKFVFN